MRPVNMWALIEQGLTAIASCSALSFAAPSRGPAERTTAIGYDTADVRPMQDWECVRYLSRNIMKVA